MSLFHLIDPTRTALLVIDVQNDYCSSSGKVAQVSGLDVSPIQKMIPALKEFIERARKQGIPIIFTKMVGDPAHMPANAALKRGQTSYCTPNAQGSEYCDLKPLASDYEIQKNTYDAFLNEQLDTLLHKHNIENLIVTGVNTAICVDTTIRSGFTGGYHIVVPQNLVAMPAERVHQHQATIEVWDFVFAHVTTSEEIVSTWENA